MSMSVASTWLLQGHAMLADSCPQPNCYSPLFRFRDGRIECPDCRTVFERRQDGDSTVLVPVSSSVQVRDHESGQNGSVQVSVDDGVPFSAVSNGQQPQAPVTEEPRSSRSLRNQCSERMGELLLSGWTMLQETCPNPSCRGIPLMRKPNSTTEMVCCNCDSTVITEQDARAQQTPATQAVSVNMNRTGGENLSPVSHPPLWEPSLVGVLESKIEALTKVLKDCPLTELEQTVRLTSTIGQLVSAIKMLQKS